MSLKSSIFPILLTFTSVSAMASTPGRLVPCNAETSFGRNSPCRPSRPIAPPAPAPIAPPAPAPVAAPVPAPIEVAAPIITPVVEQPVEQPPVTADSQGFLAAEEAAAINSKMIGDVEVISLEQFASSSKTPATIVFASRYKQLPFAIIERGGKRALIVPTLYFGGPESTFLADTCTATVAGGAMARMGASTLGGVTAGGELGDQFPPEGPVIGRVIGGAVGGLFGAVAGGLGAWGTAASCQPTPKGQSCTVEPNEPKKEVLEENGE